MLRGETLGKEKPVREREEKQKDPGLGEAEGNDI